MARIFQFPKLPRAGQQRAQPPLGGMQHPWRELWENPITQAFYRLFIAFVACTWPVLRCFVWLDLFIQLLRFFFIGGLTGFGALMHILVIGVLAYLVLRVPPIPHQ